MQSLVSQLATRLIFKQLKLVTVESCTGGWIGKVLTDTMGSSQWYEAGFITYSNLAKNKIMDVPIEMIEQYGAVSTEVAVGMAKGAQNIFPDCLSIAVTGIAGPTGGSQLKPNGTVCLACCYHGKLKTRNFCFKGNREQVRIEAVEEALKLVLAMDLNKQVKIST